MATSTYPVYVEFDDGKYAAKGAVTFAFGRPYTVNGELHATLFIESHEVKLTKLDEEK